MKRSALIVLALTLACSGGSTNPPGPKPVATVSVVAPSTTVLVGQRVEFSFAAFDASGGAVSGKSATWTSSAPEFAFVTSTGVVTGVAGGVTTITANVDGKTGSQLITVTTASEACSTTPPLALQLGEARVLSGAERSNICLLGGAPVNEYLLLAVNNSLDTTGKTLATSFSATGTAPAIGAPAALARLAAPGSPIKLQRRPGRDHAFDSRLRQTERTELGPRLRGGGRTAAYSRMRAAAVTRQSEGGGASLKGVTGVPPVGTLVTLNTRSSSSCSNPTLNTGRVVAVGTSSIIIADTLAPAGGFTTAEYQGFATTFDTLVFPLDTAAFGAPSDLDANGRVVIFFTQAVNQLTAPGASSVIGGFFFARDLFPVAGAPGLQACPASNEAEMFYVPVVDPASVYNTQFKNKGTMLVDLLGTLAHEFEHLISAGRRAYVNNADDFESVWLSEGLAHLAEELLFFRISGLSTRADIALSQINNAAVVATTNAYLADNFLRLGEYLKAPDAFSPYANNDELATRGAAWQFLRYAIDLGPGNQNNYLRALVNAKTNGMANLAAVIGPLFPGGITTAFRSWALAQFVDNTGLTADPTLQFASWNFRSVLTNQIGFTGFPLKPRALVNGGTQSFTLQAGGAAYMRFRVNPGVAAFVLPVTLPAAVDLVLVRTQ
ncbi:MAG: Ig-like domain-containing protein [Gemmatimonadetes bacterium]|nr:Ig-like domain-containing protein [Gemmatimonadota bacterium]